MTSSVLAPTAADGGFTDDVIDLHQHLWPEALVEALRLRVRGPRLVGDELRLDHEPPYRVDLADHDRSVRRARDRADGVALSVYSISAPLGIETLEPECASTLVAAWHSLADELAAESEAEGPAGRSAIWAAAGLVEPDLAALAEILTHERVVGLQVPATALLTPHLLERLAPVLAVVERADLPVLVHPGPAAQPSGGVGEVPGWWPALTDYPAQQAAAWYAWHVAGRALLPQLRIGFVALAGLAPLHHERLAQRGGNLGAIDPRVYYETSSYGHRAVDAMVRVVGVDPLVNGSDAPYATSVDPGLGPAFSRALNITNPTHFLNGGSR